MTKPPPPYFKVEAHWHFYGKCGVSISATRYRKNPDSVPMHVHDFHELVIVREGTGRHILRDGSYPLRKGKFFMIRPGVPHGYVECRNFELANVLFFPDQLLFSWEKACEAGVDRLFDFQPAADGKSGGREPPCLSAGEFDSIQPFLQAMTRERREKKADYELAMNANFIHLLQSLSRILLGAKQVPETGEPCLNRIIGFFGANYPDPALQIAGVAARYNLTVKTMERLFKKHAGVPPMAYLLTLRLERAAEMLWRNPERSITEIAFHCGFSDLAYFSRVFRRKYGFPPRDYRKNYCLPVARLPQ